MSENCAKCNKEFTYYQAKLGIKYCEECCRKDGTRVEKNNQIALDIAEGKRCPFCFMILYDRYEGKACKTSGCPLYFKLEKGWVYLSNQSGWSKQRASINHFYNGDTRFRFMKEWAEKKQEILIRDNYTCKKCNESMDGYYLKPTLQVHHIIPASKEMALYFDNDNLITLCEKCHKEVHSNDKARFGGNNG